MKLLQIGLGSMGKRRLRNLAALGEKDVVAFDFREDRRREAEEAYGVRTVSELTPELLREREAFSISTPPDHHLEYIKLAIEYGKPAFVEASVLSAGLAEAGAAAKEKGVTICPSCTFRFHPMMEVMRDLVGSGKWGAVTNFTYVLGQYLPDWHPWEDIREFYVGKRETSAAREMVPFELTWLVDLVGWPSEVFGFYGKTMEMGVDIDDTYAMSLKFPEGHMGTVLVDVVARYALREFVLNMERAQIRWSWEGKSVRLYDADRGAWTEYHQSEGNAAAGYNKNIIEEVYIAEMRAFLAAARGEATFPNTLEDDVRILSIMETVESTNRGAAL